MTAFATAVSIVILLSQSQVGSKVGIRSVSPPAAQTPPGQLLSPPIHLESWTTPQRVQPGESVQLWIAVTNLETAPVRIDLGKFDTTGFERVPPCWSQDTPACDETGTVAASRVLPPRSVVRFHGELRAGGGDGPFVLSGTATWHHTAATGTTIVKAPPLEIRSAAPAAWLEFGATLLADLAWPVVVFGLGLLLKRHQQRKRDELRDTRAAAAAERERVRGIQAEARRKRAELLATWNQMLTRSHENAEKHYLPLANAIDALMTYSRAFRAARRLERLGGAANSEVRMNATFYLLMLIRTMTDLRNAIGGFYFKDRGGEKLASLAWVRSSNSE